MDGETVSEPDSKSPAPQRQATAHQAPSQATAEPLHPFVSALLGDSTGHNQEGVVALSNLADLEVRLGELEKTAQALTELDASCFSDRTIAHLRVLFFGKKSLVQRLLTQLRDLPAGERKEAGARINATKNAMEARLESFFATTAQQLEDGRLRAEAADISLTLPEPQFGSRHPVSVVTRELLAPLIRMGFTVVDGPELESDFYNFEALNLPADHPAREMQDTFFLPPRRPRDSGPDSSLGQDKESWILRTHTSSVQVHALLERGAPLRIACPGATYRNEYDLTHIPAFRQIEGLVVDKGIHFGHLRHTLNTFFNEIFGRPVKMRFRSSYFPFTEPSAEMDVQCQQCMGAGCRACKGTGWLEMGGCGVVHRKVLSACHVSPEYSGFAFGMGIDRIAMSKFGIADLRALTEGDAAYLAGFCLS